MNSGSIAAFLSGKAFYSESELDNIKAELFEEGKACNE